MTIGLADQLRATGVDLLDPDQTQRLMTDPLAVVGLICDMHEPQWTEAGITRGDFAELCTETAAVAQAACDAAVEALADFFTRLRRPASAAVVREAMAHSDAAEKQATELVTTKGRAKLRRMLSEAIQEAQQTLDAD